MGEGQKNVPKLRFKGYEDAWEQRKLKEIGEIQTGNTPPTTDSQNYSEDGMLWVTPTDIEELVITKTAKRISEIGKKKARIASKGSVLVTCIASIGKNTLLSEDAAFNQQINSISPNGEYDSYFLLTQSFKISEKMANSAATATMQIVNKSQFSNLDTILPIYTEQVEIGRLFLYLDNIITLHQRKYDALKSMKKTLLLKMFPKDGKDVPEIRFKEFTDAWEQRKLGEVSQIVGGGTPSTGIPDYWDGDIDWYSPAEIGEEIFVSCSQRKITQLGLEKSSAKILPVGTVLFTSRAGIGNTAILEKEGCTNQGFQSIVPKDNELDSYFIFSCSHLLKKYGETKGAGSTFVEISGKQMSLMPLNIPEIKEQKSVGNFFRKLDSIITLHQRKLEELKNMKKTLLQQMFV